MGVHIETAQAAAGQSNHNVIEVMMLAEMDFGMLCVGPLLT